MSPVTMTRRTVLLSAAALAACAPDVTEPITKVSESLCYPLRPPFDVNGVIATGQSCGEGYVPPGVSGTSLSTTQPYGNLMLACEGNTWPVGGGGVYSLVPHTEPMRPGLTGDNIRYPKNLAPGSEPPNCHAVNEVSRMWAERGDGPYVFGSTNVAIGGASIVYIRKQPVGGTLVWRSYAAALEEVAIWARLCAAQGKTYGVTAIITTHGEADAKMVGYREAFVKLYDDFNADIKAITGQTLDIVMIASQESSVAGGLAGSPIQMLQAAGDRPGKIVVTGPKYWLPYADGKHLTALGYQQLGSIYAQAYETVVTREETWYPVVPLNAVRTGSSVRLTFRQSVVLDDTVPAVWANTSTAVTHGRGFEVRDAAGVYVWINNVSVESPNVVKIDLGRIGLAAPAPGPLTISYATTGTKGHLRDVDGNWCCHCVVGSP